MRRGRKVLFLISSLHRGGAERQLVELVKGLDKAEFSCVVVTVHEQGTFGPELAGLPGVELRSLGKCGAWDLVRPIWRLLGLARKAGIEVVYSFEEGPNLLGLFAAKMTGCRLVWGVRNTPVRTAVLGWKSKLYRWLNRSLARFADRIVFNSLRGAEEYRRFGYPATTSVTISNGFDTAEFSFTQAGRDSLRQQWKVGESALVFALVGSVKPDKNHRLFLEAAELAAARLPHAVFAIVGREYPNHPHLGPYAAALRRMVNDLGLEAKVFWTGEQAKMASALSAIDVLVLSSVREGTPNVVGEAMLCERPCLVTDVGDAAHLLGGNGTVFSQGDVQALAAAMVDCAGRTAEQRRVAGLAGRKRIVEEFSMKQMIDRTSEVLGDVARE